MHVKIRRMKSVSVKVPGFGLRLKKARIEAGLTQQKVADSIEVTSRHYQKYESGDVEPPLNTLVSLSIILGVTADYLLGLSDEVSSGE